MPDWPAEFPAAVFTQINPSGYAESQGAFTLRMAQEMRPRLGFPCLVDFKKQIDFPEPRDQYQHRHSPTLTLWLERVLSLGRACSLLPAHARNMS